MERLFGSCDDLFPQRIPSRPDTSRDGEESFQHQFDNGPSQ